MKQSSFFYRVKKDWMRNRSLYLMIIPVLIFFILFHYKPMYGAIIAFKDYTPALGIAESPWVGWDNFTRFFSSVYFGRLIRNTILLSFYSLLFGFPAPIILALLLNEVKNKKFKGLTQTVTYLPHFISMIVVTGMLVDFSMTSGLFNDIIELFGGERSPLLQNPDLYRTIYVASGIWQEIGWGSIIYLSALSGVDSQLYEAAQIDGAGKWKEFWKVTFPLVMPFVTINLILSTKNFLMVFDQILSLTKGGPAQSTESISYLIYKNGMDGGQFGFQSANAVLFFVVIVAISIFQMTVMGKKEEQL